MSNKTLTFKVADKSKKLSAYGLQKFPITLSPSQWEVIFAHMDAIRAFAAEHRGEFVNGE